MHPARPELILSVSQCFRVSVSGFLPKIEDVWPGNRWAHQRVADDRRLPLGAGGREKAIHRLGQRVVQRRQRLLEERLPALQRVEHRQQRQDRILRHPRLGRRAQHQVLRRRRGERAQARRSRRRHRLAGSRGRTGRSDRARACAIVRMRWTRCWRSISSARGPTSADSSPAAWRRCRSIWKKRSCACRNPSARTASARPPIDCRTGGSRDRRNAKRIALDRHRRAEPGRRGCRPRSAGSHAADTSRRPPAPIAATSTTARPIRRKRRTRRSIRGILSDSGPQSAGNRCHAAIPAAGSAAGSHSDRNPRIAAARALAYRGDMMQHELVAIARNTGTPAPHRHLGTARHGLAPRPTLGGPCRPRRARRWHVCLRRDVDRRLLPAELPQPPAARRPGALLRYDDRTPDWPASAPASVAVPTRSVSPARPSTRCVERRRTSRRHADESVTLANLARVASLSPHHLQRKFKAIVGLSPREYQAAVRAGRLRSSLRRDAT